MMWGHAANRTTIGALNDKVFINNNTIEAQLIYSTLLLLMASRKLTGCAAEAVDTSVLSAAAAGPFLFALIWSRNESLAGGCCTLPSFSSAPPALNNFCIKVNSRSLSDQSIHTQQLVLPIKFSNSWSQLSGPEVAGYS